MTSGIFVGSAVRGLDLNFSKLFITFAMSKPPPFIYGVTRFWAAVPFDEEQRRFPVSMELYFAVRRILTLRAKKLVDIRELEMKTRKIQVNVHGETVKELLAQLLPRLHALYVAMNSGTNRPSC